MSYALEEHDRKVIIRGRNITNLRFSDDSDALEIRRNLGSQEDQIDDKQCQWHPEGDKGIRADAGYRNKFQVPRRICFRKWLQTTDSLKDCPSHSTLTKLKPIWRDTHVTIYLLDQRWNWCAPLSFPNDCLWIMGLGCRQKNAGLWDEMLPKNIEHFIQGPCYQCGRSSQKDPSRKWRLWRTPDPGQEAKNDVVW